MSCETHGNTAKHDARTVRAMLCHNLSGPDGLTIDRIPREAPKSGEVRLRVRACGVNFPDLLMTRGLYQFKPDPPFCPGMEVSGEVLELGADVKGFAVGDRVVARTMSLYPGFAEEITLPASYLLSIPKAMNDVTAAALFVTYYTSYNALVEKAHLQSGETVLVHGAAGGVGLAAVQIAHALGAKVIATAGSAEKIAFLRKQGVSDVINYSDEDIRARVKEITGGAGVDVALDPVGGAAFDASVRSLAPGGRLCVVGFTSGSMGSVPSNIVLIKEISVIGIRAGEFALRHPDRMRAGFARLCDWFEAGKIAPEIARKFPLEQAADALRALEERSAIGKVVVTIS
nr:NADPH:quinone oxidoreductase family protein [Amylibacter sp.]